MTLQCLVKCGPFKFEIFSMLPFLYCTVLANQDSLLNTNTDLCLVAFVTTFKLYIHSQLCTRSEQNFLRADTVEQSLVMGLVSACLGCLFVCFVVLLTCLSLLGFFLIRERSIIFSSLILVTW